MRQLAEKPFGNNSGEGLAAEQIQLAQRGR